jgi:osmotically-inducible protein OsmY
MQRVATEFAAVWKFRFGTPIHTEDGELGTIAALGVDLATRAVGDVGIKFGLLGKIHYVPISTISESSAEGASTSLQREGLEKGAEAPSTGLTLSAKTRVALNGKRLGGLTQVTINRETRVLRHIVVDRGLGGEVLVAAADIAQLDARQIQLNVGQTGAAPLTPFRPDEELYEEVRQAIEGYPRLRIDLNGIEIHAIDGVVWLKGYVSSELNRRLVQDQLTNIRGLAELHNELMTDPDVAAAISSALATDPRTAGEHIGVYPTLGEVHLRGMVRSEAARVAAGQIAASVPGVKSVQNDLRVDANASVLPVLASVTNEEDRVPGGS